MANPRAYPTEKHQRLAYQDMQRAGCSARLMLRTVSGTRGSPWSVILVERAIYNAANKLEQAKVFKIFVTAKANPTWMQCCRVLEYRVVRA